MVRRLLSCLVALAPPLAACGDDAAATSSGGGAGGAVETTSTSASGPGPVAVSSGTETGTGSSGAGGANPEDPYGCLLGEAPPRPASIPEGYRPWACWSQKPQCMLWIPEDPETMVDPITWEACAEGSPGGDGCRQMARPWWSGQGPAIGETYPAAPELDRTGASPMLRFAKASLAGSQTSDFVEWAVHDLDGAPRFALRRPPQGEAECGFQDYDLSEGFWVVAPVGDDTTPTSDSPHDGALLVDLASRSIDLAYRDDQPAKASWTAGAGWLARDTGVKLFLHDHAFQQELLLHDAATDPFGANATSAVFIHGDRVVWSISAGEHSAIRAYDPILGPHDLVRYADPMHGAGALGSDGVDLVWMDGEGRQPGDISFPIRSIFTAPFTTDPELLAPRRLRSDPSTALNALGDRFHVGCGRAARHGTTPLDLQIVRLSDGMAWYVDHTPGVWKKSSIVGLTCDEVFIVVQFWEDAKLQGSTIQRIRFDALGEGVPPD